MEPQLTSFRESFVRISTEDGIPVGAGFLVLKGHVLTCAHVVAAALGDDAIEAQAQIPQGPVNLNFHFLRGQPLCTATVIHWQPRVGSQTSPSGDIAVLQPIEDLPFEARAIRLTAANELFGHAFRAHGFPRDTDSGVWVYGLVRDPLGNGWLQVEDTKEQGRRIEQGFSGGPVQDQATGRFVGMVAASSEYIKAAKVGYVIPTKVLIHAYPPILDQGNQQTIQTATVLRIRREMQELDSTIRDVEAGTSISKVRERLDRLRENTTDLLADLNDDTAAMRFATLYVPHSYKDKRARLIYEARQHRAYLTTLLETHDL